MANILGKYNLVKFIPKTIGNLNRPIFMEKKQLPKICLQYTTHTHTHTHTLLLCLHLIIIVITGPQHFPRKFYQIIKDQRQGQRKRTKTSKYFYKARLKLLLNITSIANTYKEKDKNTLW